MAVRWKEDYTSTEEVGETLLAKRKEGRHFWHRGSSADTTGIEEVVKTLLAQRK